MKNSDKILPLSDVGVLFGENERFDEVTGERTVQNSETDFNPITVVAEAMNLTSSEHEIQIQTNNSNENLVIQIALQGFSSLEEFNNCFLEYDSKGNASLMSDHTFIIPDTLGDSGTTKQHGWSEFPSEKKEEDVSVYDERTGHTTYQYQSDGFKVREIRKVLAERGDIK